MVASQKEATLEQRTDDIVQGAAGWALPRATLHDLRAAHIQTCFTRGLTVPEVARRLGDDPKTIWAHYSRRPVGEAESVRAKLNGGAGGASAGTLGRIGGASVEEVG